MIVHVHLKCTCTSNAQGSLLSHYTTLLPNQQQTTQLSNKGLHSGNTGVRGEVSV